MIRTRRTVPHHGCLPEIPVIDAPGGPIDLARHHLPRLRRLMAMILEVLPNSVLAWSDRRSRSWLDRSSSPYGAEIAEVADLAGWLGCHALNLSFEWGCTSGCAARGDDHLPTLYRVLDWPLRVGGEVVVARHQTPVGPYLNITWPGFVGVLTGMAPGRFAAAINQAPIQYTFKRRGLTLPVDWAVNRWRVARQTALPPAHLLRRVFETCTTYAEARQMLETTPICISAIFTLSGTAPGEGCVIERTEQDFSTLEMPVAAANHWTTPRFRGRPRIFRSRTRQAVLRASIIDGPEGLTWLHPPVLNGLTRLIAEMSAAEGILVVQGRQGNLPRTAILRLDPVGEAAD